VTAAPRTYDADIRYTTHGVPHISAADWGSLGFGQGWCCASDHLATLADQVLKVRSERARFFGAGPNDRHLNSDLGYLALDARGRAETLAAAQPTEVVDLVEGYAAGINAWLAEHGRGALPAWARDAEWVRPVTPLDLYATYVDLALIASSRNLAEYIGSAVPPGAGPDGSMVPPPDEARLDGGLASNGWALGRDATSGGLGLVMANPHFPWYGEARFWECHLTIPGELDVYGASLIGTPGVSIGFNAHLAWTHTFSVGNRFTVYKLDQPAGPTTYRYGDEVRSLTSHEHTVPVRGDDGTVRDVQRTLWSSHYGPMLNLPLIGWGPGMGFTFRDANIDNTRILAQTLAVDRATSVAELRDAVATHQGLPWVNTIAADDTGTCWYADTSSTPNLTPEAQLAFEDALVSDPLTAIAFSMRVALLDGSDPANEWVDDPRAASAGLVPHEELPQITTTDHVFNSNDPYWLPHAVEQLPRHPTFCGLHHRPVSPRTRMNALLVSGAGPVTPSGPDGRLTPDDVEASVLGNHSLVARLLLDDMIVRLDGIDEVTVDGRSVALAPAIDVLRAWDRRFDIDSVGAVLFRELLAGFSADELKDAGGLWSEPFDPTDPVATPRGLAPAPPDATDDTAKDPLVAALARAIQALEAAGVPIDAPLGDVQWVARGGRRIGVSGGFELEGIANVLSPLGTLPRSDLEPPSPMPAPVPGRTERTGLYQGGYPITYGTSWLMLTWWDEPGQPQARGLLAYGQSGDPESIHHVDQVEAFAAKALRPLRFTDADIDADPALTHRHLSG